MRALFATAVCGFALTVMSAQSGPDVYVFSTLAGRVGSAGYIDGSSASAHFDKPWAVATDSAGNVYVADAGNYTVRRITPAGVVTTFAGSAGTTGTLDGVGADARFGTLSTVSSSTVAGPLGLAIDGPGNIFVADSFSHTLRRITPGGEVTTLSGVAGMFGSANGGPTAARYYVPYGVAVDAKGNVYVTDTYNHVIRQISTNGVVTTIAGSVGDWGTADGVGNLARFLYPTAIASAPTGSLFVTDSNNTIRRISPPNESQASWVTTTIAGTPETYGTTDGLGSAARFGSQPSTSATGGNAIRVAPTTPGQPPVPIGRSYAIGELPGIAVDATGNIFVSDYGNNRIRKISAAGAVTTIGGSTAGSTDGIAARFSRPAGIAVDAAGNLYIADSANNTIRKGTRAAAPVIQTQPASLTAGVGGTLSLTVVATATPAPTFQWSKNGVVIPGATAGTLTLANVQPSTAGTYIATIRNAVGSITSSPATVSVVEFPVLLGQPVSQTVSSGETLILSVQVAGSTPLALQWYRDGVPIPGATSASLVLPAISSSASGDYVVVATNSFGSVSSAPARVVVSTTRIANLSVRSSLEGGDALIVGFVTTGGAKPLLVRAIGPALRGFGVNAAMVDPLLNLHTSTGMLVASNDNWGAGVGLTQLANAASQVGAFDLPSGSLDAAALVTALDGAMTAQAASRENAGGIVLIELYDAAPLGLSRIINVSARARVGAGESALFAGFVISGSASKTLLVRAVGPTLGAFGVAGVLSDPRLDIFATGAPNPLASNDDWGGDAALVSTFRAVSAFPLPASESRDAALIVNLPPGAFTAQISGVGGVTGEVLLEIYEVP